MTDAQDSLHRKQIVTALLVGMGYGLLTRVTFELKSLSSLLQIVSAGFLFVAPFCVGAVAVLWYAKGQHVPVKRQLGLSINAMLLFLAAMMVTLLEGLICIVLVAPVFLVASMLGGLLAGYINNRFKVSRSTLPVFALLPLLIGPIEAHLPPEQSEQTVSNTIVIHAPPDIVFDQLAAVRDIRPAELGFSFVHLIGLPKPVEAAMDGSGVGSVRTSRWEKGVEFKEVITEWNRPVALHYQFRIPPGSIPRHALDRHVELGGDYFTVLDGGYDLVRLENGDTRLSLTTRFLNKSHLKLYGDLWGRMVLADFHQSILGLMKNRAEKANLSPG
ncbi:MAG: hypothetical protein OEZ39_09205 [Gammaproteobacteria bacterium]|nr:hypothetical protein [Gammaproteobacteria bacterium]MDH5652021.1 hypothetical protein [Gammaproteobacteria bacterium]